MGYIAILQDGSAITEDFKKIDMSKIVKLQSDLKGIPITIDMRTGGISVNDETVSREQATRHYNKTDYKPIQYRKVTELIGMEFNSFESFEQQFIGYEYTHEDTKYKVVIEIQEEIDAVILIEQKTDLIKQVKEPETHTRLL